MGELSSAIDAEQAVDLDALTHEQLRERVVELRRQHVRLDAELVRTVAAVDQRGAHDSEAARSSRAWLAAVTRMVPREASRFVRLGRWLRDLPTTAAAYAAGDIDGDVAQRIGGLLRHVDADVVRAYEPALLDAAHTVDADRMQVLTQRILDRHEPDITPELERRQWEQRELTMSRSFGGMWHISGTLDPETAAPIAAVLAARSHKNGVEDSRTAKQRRADALRDVCVADLNTGATPNTGAGKVRSHVIMRVDYGAFVTGHGGEIFDGTMLSNEAVRRVLCDAGVSRVVMAGESQVLNAGMAARTVSPAQWRALAIRDGGCDFPGCSSPPQECVAHHVAHWVDGGPTDLANLVLLCEMHHHMLHEEGWRIVHFDGVASHYRSPVGRDYSGEGEKRRRLRKLERDIVTGDPPPAGSRTA